MKISCMQRNRGGPAFGGAWHDPRPCVTVTYSRREVIDALRLLARAQGYLLPPGDAVMQRATAAGDVELIVRHEEDDWQPDDRGACVDDAFEEW